MDDNEGDGGCDAVATPSPIRNPNGLARRPWIRDVFRLIRIIILHLTEPAALGLYNATTSKQYFCIHFCLSLKVFMRRYIYMLFVRVVLNCYYLSRSLSNVGGAAADSVMERRCGAVCANSAAETETVACIKHWWLSIVR